MTTTTLPRTATPMSARPSFWRLVRAELTEIRFFWLIPVGVTLANLLINKIVALAVEPGAADFSASSVLSNWAFSWAILFFVVGILRGTASTPETALAGAGLKAQNRVGWTTDGIEAIGAGLVWTLVAALVPASETFGVFTEEGPILGLPGPSFLFGGFLLLALWALIGGIGRIIGHAYRLWSTWGGLATIIGLIALLSAPGPLIARSAPTLDQIPWTLPLLVLGGFGVVVVLIAWLLAERGPIRTVG